MTEAEIPTPRLLSVQSHVVHGYVGNKAAVFPLQLLGFDVDFINSVQFSNHTEYKYVQGQKLDAEQLGELIDGLKQNNLVNYTHLLTGYVGNKSFLNKLADIITEMKSDNPELIYLCDPVMGDDGKFYVPKELLDVYIKRILPLADIITPNLFELELIYGKSISSFDDMKSALSYCHKKFAIKKVVVSSCQLFNDKSNKSSLFASSIHGDSLEIIKIDFDRVHGSFSGTGDAFAAMLIAWLSKLDNMKDACEHSVSAMLHILKRTLSLQNPAKMVENVEMELIKSKRDIEDPEIVVSGETFKYPIK